MLIVEDGTAMSDAESYASITFADTYHTARSGEDSEWLALEDDAKERDLRKATDYMIETYRGRWKGELVSQTQVLDWPRQNVVKDEKMGWVLPHDSVPLEVQRACVELALKAETAELAADVEPTDSQVTSETVGPISVSYAVSGQKQVKYTTVDNMLKTLLEDFGGMTRTLGLS